MPIKRLVTLSIRSNKHMIETLKNETERAARTFQTKASNQNEVDFLRSKDEPLNPDDLRHYADRAGYLF